MIYVTIECDECGNYDEAHAPPVSNAIRAWRRGGGTFSGSHDVHRALCYECADKEAHR